jgi:flagellar hook-length control protein FliK
MAASRAGAARGAPSTTGMSDAATQSGSATPPEPKKASPEGAAPQRAPDAPAQGRADAAPVERAQRSQVATAASNAAADRAPPAQAFSAAPGVVDPPPQRPARATLGEAWSDRAARTAVRRAQQTETRAADQAVGAARSARSLAASAAAGADAAPASLSVAPSGVRGEEGDATAPFSVTESAGRSAAAPTAGAAPAAGPVPDRFGEGAARALAQAIAAGADRNRIELRLDPPELGRVAIDLRLDDGAVSASVSADRPETLDLLRRHADALQRELSGAGFDRATLSFGDRSADRGAPGGFAAPDGAAGAGGESDAAAQAAHAPRPQRAPAGASDRLDIRL